MLIHFISPVPATWGYTTFVSLKQQRVTIAQWSTQLDRMLKVASSILSLELIFFSLSLSLSLFYPPPHLKWGKGADIRAQCLYWVVGHM